jgi:hypothetical protein
MDNISGLPAPGEGGQYELQEQQEPEALQQEQDATQALQQVQLYKR